jgi:uncharacterized protein (DUF488 family)
MSHYTVFTIGHGQLSWDGFRAITEPYHIELLADIRSWPYSDLVPWFNRDRLEQSARRAGMEYVWLGSQLGPLTEDGRLDYLAKEREPRYSEGIRSLLDLSAAHRCCLFAANAEPLESHRHLLVAQTLLRLHVDVRHILHNGHSTPAQADLLHSTL